jgi:hypothetical protein
MTMAGDVRRKICTERGIGRTAAANLVPILILPMPCLPLFAVKVGFTIPLQSTGERKWKEDWREYSNVELKCWFSRVPKGCGGEVKPPPATAISYFPAFSFLLFCLDALHRIK